jgi:hypothetical protein
MVNIKITLRANSYNKYNTNNKYDLNEKQEADIWNKASMEEYQTKQRE